MINYVGISFSILGVAASLVQGNYMAAVAWANCVILWITVTLTERLLDLYKDKDKEK